MSGYCTLPRPKNWPCACRVNVKSYFDRSALECHGCGLLVTGDERVRMLFPEEQPADSNIAADFKVRGPDGIWRDADFPNAAASKETFDAEAHRNFMKSLG